MLLNSLIFVVLSFLTINPFYGENYGFPLFILIFLLLVIKKVLNNLSYVFFLK